MRGRLLVLVAFLLSACHSADQSPTSDPSSADQSGDGLSFYFQYFDNFAVPQIGDIIQLNFRTVDGVGRFDMRLASRVEAPDGGPGGVISPPETKFLSGTYSWDVGVGAGPLTLHVDNPYPGGDLKYGYQILERAKDGTPTRIAVQQTPEAGVQKLFRICWRPDQCAGECVNPVAQLGDTQQKVCLPDAKPEGAECEDSYECRPLECIGLWDSVRGEPSPATCRARPGLN
jgi:hypothetical protein